MSFRAVTGALMAGAFVAMAVAVSPALACKGSESLLRDDFNETDPAWNTWFPDGSSFSIGGGKLQAKSDPGKWGVLQYEGAFFPAADACVEISAPSVRDPANIWAGLAFETADGALNVVRLNLDGTAAVSRVTGAGWLSPVPARKFAGLKPGPNVVNKLRVVWKGPPARDSKEPADPAVQIFINDQSFITFKATPNADRKIGFAVQSDGNTYQLSNLAVTR
jgi:hypothetical protein